MIDIEAVGRALTFEECLRNGAVQWLPQHARFDGPAVIRDLWGACRPEAIVPMYEMDFRVAEVYSRERGLRFFLKETPKSLLYQTAQSVGVPHPAWVGAFGADRLLFELRRFLEVHRRCLVKPDYGFGSRGVCEFSLKNFDGQWRSYVDAIEPDWREFVVCEILGDAELSSSRLLALDVVVSSVGVSLICGFERVGVASNGKRATKMITVSPNALELIVDDMARLCGGLRRVVGVENFILHTEWIFRGAWHVIDISMRPGGGVIPHVTQAITGIDLRLLHLKAALGMSLEPLPLTVGHSQVGVMAGVDVKGSFERVQGAIHLFRCLKGLVALEVAGVITTEPGRSDIAISVGLTGDDQQVLLGDLQRLADQASA